MDGVRSVDIGRVRVTALLDGEADLDPIVETFPDAPAEPLLALRDRYPGMYGPNDEMHFMVRTWLIEHPEGLALVDTGVGPAEWFPADARLHGELAAAGVAASDVDTVIVTHVHDDHIGGNVTPGGEPAFPNARYVVQAADVAAQRAWAEDDDEDRDVWERLIRPLLTAGAIHEVDGDTELTSTLHLQHAPGHTPGHQVVHVRDDDAHLVITGDTWNHPGQLAHPEWPSGPDRDHELAAATRRRIFPEIFTAEHTLVAPTHFPTSFGTFVIDEHGEPAWRSLDR
jgi:glyoxylase-like metal-dependent hydrolase (beta-lactamase superfamily II)